MRSWSMRGGCCGGSPSGHTPPKSSTSRPSSCGSRPPGGPFRGTGGSFPGPEERANVGLGLGTVGDRRAGARVQQELPRFLGHVREIGLLTGSARTVDSRRLGGWLKMGVRRHDSGSGACAPRRGRRRSRESAAGRGDRPGHGQRSLRGGGTAGRARSCRGVLPGHTGGRPSAVPPDHRGHAGVAGRSAPRRRRRVPGAHDRRPERRHRRRMVGLLERVARRRTPQSTPVRRRGGDPTWPADDGAHVHGAVVQCVFDAGRCCVLLRRAGRIGSAGTGSRRTRHRQPNWSEVSRCPDTS